ncbi:MAG: RpiR family transcriptional regulator, partial [Mycobacterium sp.]|nr:RpiR family transcriptional regulator [Mycobacterium sp.]
GAKETDFRVEAVTSRIAHIAVFDALHAAVFLKTMRRAGDAQRLTAEALTPHRI